MTLATVRLTATTQITVSVGSLIYSTFWVISVFCIAVIGESLLCYSLEE